jgi:hypothetical protein
MSLPIPLATKPMEAEPVDDLPGGDAKRRSFVRCEKARRDYDVSSRRAPRI